MRSTLFVCAFALLSAGTAGAAEYKGTVKKVDAEKGVLTLSVDGKEMEFAVPATASVKIQVASRNIETKDGLKSPWFKRAAEASGKGYRAEVTTEKKDGKDVVTKVQLFTPTRE
jgi:hypothetical protein